MIIDTYTHILPRATGRRDGGEGAEIRPRQTR